MKKGTDVGKGTDVKKVRVFEFGTGFGFEFAILELWIIGKERYSGIILRETRYLNRRGKNNDAIIRRGSIVDVVICELIEDYYWGRTYVNSIEFFN